MTAPARVTLLIVGGFLLLGGLTYGWVLNLQREAMAEASAVEGRRSEEQMMHIVERLAAEELGPEGGNLNSFARRLIALVEEHPAYLDVVVLDARRRTVRQYSRRAAAGVPCLGMVEIDRSVEGEHPAGQLAKNPVACKSIPVLSGGEARGAVLFHVERDWGAYSEHVGSLVHRLALRIAPVFAAFYLLLGALLISASRALRKWRSRAASFERVQALGALADGINHEIKNPLNAVGLSLQYLGRKHDDPETREVVDTATREADRIRDQLEEFVRFTRVSHLETEDVSLGGRLRARFHDRDRLEIRGDADARVDLGKVGEALASVIDFVARHCASGPVTATLSQTAKEWQAVVAGQACEVDPPDVARFFDPYVRARPHDVGRGLALARAVFQAHGGDLVAQLKGARLVLRGHAPRRPPGERGKP